MGRDALFFVVAIAMEFLRVRRLSGLFVKATDMLPSPERRRWAPSARSKVLLANRPLTFFYKRTTEALITWPHRERLRRRARITALPAMA